MKVVRLRQERQRERAHERAWSQEFGIECAHIEEVVERSDYLIVLSPDNPEFHEELSQLPRNPASRPISIKRSRLTAKRLSACSTWRQSTERRCIRRPPCVCQRIP